MKGKNLACIYGEIRTNLSCCASMKERSKRLAPDLRGRPGRRESRCSSVVQISLFPLIGPIAKASLPNARLGVGSLSAVLRPSHTSNTNLPLIWDALHEVVELRQDNLVP